MTRVVSVCLMSFLLALLAVIGLDVYTAKHPELDESGLLSTLNRVVWIVPSRARIKTLKIHGLRHNPAVHAGPDSTPGGLR